MSNKPCPIVKNMYYNKTYLGKASYSIMLDIGKYACGPGRAGPKLAAGRPGRAENFRPVHISSWWSSEGNQRRRASAARRLNRDEVMQICRLDGCEDFARK